MNKLKQLIGVFVLVSLLLLTGSWLMHKFYVSLTEIRYNEQTERFEISMRIFPDDLDLALLERSGLHTQLATELEHEKADSLLMIYLLEDFKLRVDGEELDLKYLGKEPESDAVWCYLESSKVPEPGTVTIFSALLTEFFPEQVNIIQVYHGTWNRGLLLNLGETKGKLTIGE